MQVNVAVGMGKPAETILAFAENHGVAPASPASGIRVSSDRAGFPAVILEHFNVQTLSDILPAIPSLVLQLPYS